MTNVVNPQALIIARESRGRTQKEVADAAGVTQGAISQAETDTFTLKQEHLDRIGKFLDYPVTFFYEEGRLRDGESVCHHHSKRKTLPAKVLNRVNATMFARVVNVRHMMNGLEVFGPREFHAMDVEEFGTPEAVAQALRAAWRVADGPIPDLVELVESAGAIVVLAPFGHRKLSGMSCWPTQARTTPLFYLNSDMPTADLRWTIAHELGHLTMHASPSADPEREADKFAAEFLTPARSIAPDLKHLTFDRLGVLKFKWKVSMKALVRRADDLGCITKPETVRLYKFHSARGFNAYEPYEVPPERPTIAARAAEVHLKEHGYTPKQLRDALRITRLADYYEVTGQHSRRGNLSAVS